MRRCEKDFRAASSPEETLRSSSVGVALVVGGRRTVGEPVEGVPLVPIVTDSELGTGQCLCGD